VGHTSTRHFTTFYDDFQQPTTLSTAYDSLRQSTTSEAANDEVGGSRDSVVEHKGNVARAWFFGLDLVCSEAPPPCHAFVSVCHARGTARI
jgi:hypothetical protein